MIDTDVHNNFRSLQDLFPWLDPGHRNYFQNAGYGFSLPVYPWLHPEGFARDDAIPSEGGPGSDYELLRAQLLDAFDVEYAILTGEDIMMIGCLPHPQFAAALATAYNRWLREEWLPRDERLKGSVHVAIQDPARAADEIRAFGDHPNIVQVVLPGGTPVGYGHPQYHPIYEAAVDVGLPVTVHVGNEGMGINAPASATGYPVYYIEWHTLLPTTAMSHVVSLVCHGVFEKYPELRVAIIEADFVWLPGLLWRLDANWKAIRAEVPWVKGLPSETVRQHMRFSTQPLAQPADGRELRQVLEAVPWLKDLAMFATDYPHWDTDDPTQIARRLPAEWQESVMSENARSFYKLPGGSAFRVLPSSEKEATGAEVSS